MKRAVRAEVYCAGWVLAPIRDSPETRISFVTCLQSGHGPPVPVACGRLFNQHHATRQLEQLADYLHHGCGLNLDRPSGFVTKPH